MVEKFLSSKTILNPKTFWVKKNIWVSNKSLSLTAVCVVVVVEWSDGWLMPVQGSAFGKAEQHYCQAQFQSSQVQSNLTWDLHYNPCKATHPPTHPTHPGQVYLSRLGSWNFV